jgi:hypothetical protein
MTATRWMKFIQTRKRQTSTGNKVNQLHHYLESDSQLRCPVPTSTGHLSFPYLRFVRRSISILLLTLLLANFAGSYLYFAFRALQIKREMRALLATLPEEELELIILTPEEFKQARVEDHEIKVNGNMFDIARVVEKESKLFVYGVYDEDEDSLLSFLNAVVSNLQKDSSQTPPSFSLFSLLHYLPVQFDYNLTALPSKSLSPTFYNYSFVDFISVIDSPPPK